MCQPNKQTPGPSTAGPKSKGKQVAKRKGRTPAEDAPWNPVKERFPITRAQWNERNKRGGGLSARAQTLRDVWDHITTTVLRQFGIDDDEELFSTKVDQFKLAWQRMMACMPDESPENRLNRAIAIAVSVEIQTSLEKALAPWKGK